MNARSVCNKTFELHDFITEKALDACAITETWLKGGIRDDVVIAELLPSGYGIHHHPRASRGGGVGLIFKQCMRVDKKAQLPNSPTSFEYIECLVNLQPPLRILIVYRPPSTSVQVFVDELDHLLEHLVMSSGQLLVLGDFNIHFDNPECAETRMLLDMINCYGFELHVTSATHRSGHTLDMVMSLRTHLQPHVYTMDVALSDHYVIMCSIDLSVPAQDSRLITYRSLKKIDCVRFTRDISQTTLHSHPDQWENDANAPALLDEYNSVLSSLLDKHAPVKTKVLPLRDQSPWYTDELRSAKQERRQSERRWLKTGLHVHRDAMVEKRRQLNAILRRAKSNYYVNLIEEHHHDPKKMFGIVSGLLGKTKSLSLPKHTDERALADEFSEFFVKKVEAIRASIPNTAPAQVSSLPAMPQATAGSLATWTQVTTQEIHRIITHSPTKHCALDPVPTWLLKRCLDPLLPSITALINTSLASGSIPALFKVAHVSPLLKGPSLDVSNLNNYRPVSNLPFLSKVLERVVNSQLSRYLIANDLQEKFQSAYRANHSTETALVRVQNDLLLALSERETCLLLLLDLSAAFDTVDHSALINVLNELGVTGIALAWFKSYLNGRTQQVRIGEHCSSPQPLNSGVPQGSVLGPALFTLYTASLGRLIKTFNVDYHFYADDSSLYVTFDAAELDQSVHRLQDCVKAVQEWMRQKRLKMNPNKTELLFVATKNVQRQVPAGTPVVKVGDNDVTPSEAVRYIGVLLDKHLSMDKYIDSVCKSARFHLFNIGRIRHLLTRGACEQIIHAFVSSRLDYGNALLYGLSQRQLMKLQRVQNSAARIVARIGRYDHITPVMKELHWLPIAHRVRFKIALLVYKCVHGLAPEYLTELLHLATPARPLRSAQLTNLLRRHRSTNTLSDRAFSTHAPAIWNELPESVRATDDLVGFKKKLKTHLFTLAYHMYF